MRKAHTPGPGATASSTQPRVPTKPASVNSGATRPGVGRMGASAPAKLERPSIIPREQREAMQVSAFGFRTGRRGQDAGSAGMTAKERSLARSLHTTGRADVVVARPEKDSLRFRLCVQALSGGCVQAYMRLFHLAHRDPVCVDELSQAYFTIPDSKLRWVQETLSAVEVLRRQSEFKDVFLRCRELADYFELERDVQEAVWHYEAALRYALESLDRELEQEVRDAFATFYERCGQFTEAAHMYESMHRLSVAVGDEEKAERASVKLARTYQILGNQLKRRDPQSARRYYELSAKAARRSKSAVEEGTAYSALGEVNEQTGNLRKALQYQQSFLVVAKREHQRDAECDAVLNVAGLEERLGMNIQAAVTLKEALELANQLGDASKICQATMQLGEVSRAQDDEQTAMECFRRAFEAACESGKQDLIDSARVAMGFAIGEFYFTHAGSDRGYLPIICEDIRGQLAWMSTGVL